MSEYRLGTEKVPSLRLEVAYLAEPSPPVRHEESVGEEAEKDVPVIGMLGKAATAQKPGEADILPQKGEDPEEAFLAELQLNASERPLYLAYYQAIRERIRRHLYRRYGRETRGGEVALSFVLFSNGRLKTVTANPGGVMPDRRLREIALQSVIEASPFPPFPEGLARPFIPFRIGITFIDDRTVFSGDS